MATGQSAQPGQGMVLTDVTPGIDFRTGEAEMWGQVGRLADQITEANRPGQQRRAEEIGAREGQEAAAETVAGRPTKAPRPLPAFGEMAEARMAAAERAYQAGVRNDYDTRELEVRSRLSHQPEEYRREMAAVRSAFIQNSPPEYAVDFEEWATVRINAGVADVSSNALGVQLKEHSETLAARQGNLARLMADELTATGAPTVRYEILRDEYEQITADRLANPAIAYSEAEADADRLELTVTSKAAIYTHNARAVLREEGAPAALASLQEVLTDADLGESERGVVFQKVRATINQEVDLMTDQANMARSAQTRAEEAMLQRIEDYAGAMELGTEPPPLTEAEVTAVLGVGGVAEWYRKNAEALERNRETGILAGLTPEEAAQRIADSKEVASASGDFEPIVNWIIDDSEGSALVADDNGAGRARYGITERSHPEAWRDGDVTRQEAVAIYKAKYWDAIGADGLAKDLRIVAFDAAINHGPDLARRWIEESGGDAARYIELRRTHYRALAASNPAKYGDDLRGWMNRLDAVTTRVQAMGAGNLTAEAYTNAREGFSSDPINFAFTHRLAGRIELPVDAVFQGGEATAQWGEALRARAALGGNLADQRQVPLRVLTNGEAAAYRDRFARDPGAAVEFAEIAARYLGGRGARDALAEIGQGDVAPALIHIGDLAAAGGSRRFADNAARGLQLKAAGQKLESDRAAEVQEALADIRAPFANSPSLLQAISATAEAAAIADAVDGNTNRPASYYVQAAAGRTQWEGRQYGGVTQLNGRPTLLPTWLNPDMADDALERLAESWERTGGGPVYSNNGAMPARVVAGLRMAIQPNGKYRLVDRDGRAAYARSGEFLEVDLEVFRPFLTARLGRAGVKPD